MLKTIKNPYLEAYEATVPKKRLEKWDIMEDVKVHEARRRLTKKYSFAIPNRRAIDAIVELSPVVELGAGTGYWASLVQQRGGRIDAYDKFTEGNEYKFESRYYPVTQGAEDVLESYGSEHSLLLCWPCYNTIFAFNALRRFGGNTLIYVGEGYGGCCGDDLFHETLDNCWDLADQVEIPQWPFIHDSFYIYRRKKNGKMD